MIAESSNSRAENKTNPAKKIDAEQERWLQEVYKTTIKKSFSRERKKEFHTLSEINVKPIYTPADLSDFSYLEKLGFPGEYPYTRGVQSTMYRGRLWTMRQFSGFGSAQETNQRYKYLLASGTTGLSVAFHLPTIMGYDSDHEFSRGEVGKCGVAIDSLADMETLFEGIPLEQVTTSMTINAPAAILLAMYIAVAEKQGADIKKISGTIQNDLLKEYIAQKSYVFPPRPSMRIITDIFSFCSKHIPRWNSISISGYHIREAGSTAVQELAFTLADGLEYVKAATEVGLDIDEFAPRLSFFFNAHNDLFEEVAKYRAARRMWAHFMKERFKAKDPRSLWLRFHTQTAGCSLAAQQPYNNVIRVTVQALAGVLGGTQSLHTNSLDETLALPSAEAVTIAVRTQQIIAHESGVTNTIDPLAGSYYVEYLTNEVERQALDYIKKIDALGGMVPAIEQGFPQREIQDASFRYQQQIEAKDRIIVGVNEYQSQTEEPIEILQIDENMESAQIKKVQQVRQQRNNQAVKETLVDLKKIATGEENIMPAILNAVKAYATIGEIMDTLREVFGEYQEPPIF